LLLSIGLILGLQALVFAIGTQKTQLHAPARTRFAFAMAGNDSGQPGRSPR